MLTSITPLGERGRGNRWWLTTLWLLIGHLAGGAALGTAMVAGSIAVDAAIGRPSASSVVLIVGAAALVAVAGDLAGLRPPGRRQVDERWLTSYRGWVYGAGFGVQLGFGLVTVVNTLLLAVVILAGVLLVPSHALVLGIVYGLTRGAGAALGGRVRSVGDLRRLHRLLDQRERAATWVSLGAVVAVATGAMVLA